MTTKDRFIDMLFVAVLEILVAASTLIYCYFLMPLFFTLKSAWLQMLWLCVLHPLYFEIFTGFIVRKVLYRNRSLGRTDVVYFLTIVHAMVHTVALATSLQVRPPILLCMVFVYTFMFFNFLHISLIIVGSGHYTITSITCHQASIEPIRILAVTMLLYNLSKMIW